MRKYGIEHGIGYIANLKMCGFRSAIMVFEVVFIYHGTILYGV